MKKINSIAILSTILSILIALPLLNVFKNIFNPSEFKVLPAVVYEALGNTLFMMIAVAVLTVLLATSIAWIVNIYEFKGRKLFQLLLLLPFGIPAYIMAEAYADFFSYTGFISAFLRNHYGIRFSLDVMNIYGAIFIYTLSLFAYIYIFCNSYYNRYAAVFVENSLLLGVTGFDMFRRVGIKIARIPIISGVSLVLMEVISNYGVVSYYGIPAFTTIFYKIWIAFADFSAAIKLAAVVMVLIFLLLALEHHYSKKMKFYVSSKVQTFNRIKPKKSKLIAIYFYLTTIVFFALIIPLFQLIYNSYYSFADVINWSYLKIIGDTILYCSIAAFLTVLVAFIFVNFTVNSKGIMAYFTKRVATLGYSIPGIIIAIAVMFSFHELDRLLRPLYVYFNFNNKLFLSKSIIILIFAYLVRFLTIAYNQIYSSRVKYNPNLFESARTLGYSQVETLFKIDLPLLQEANILAFFLVFLEVLKELPITLLLKPIGLNTLTIEVHKFYSNEMIKESSVPSLMIVAIGIALNCFIIYYKRRSDSQQKRRAHVNN